MTFNYSVDNFFYDSCNQNVYISQHAVGVRQPKPKVPWYLSFFLLPYWSDTSESVEKTIHQRSSRGAICKKLYLPYETKPELRGEITKESMYLWKCLDHKKPLIYFLLHTHFKKKIVISFYACHFVAPEMGNFDFRENSDFHVFSLSQYNEGTYVKTNHNFFLKVGMERNKC